MEKNITWWKKALVYQIYPLSFKDSNGDGIGDIQGIISKLDYLKDYGVDVIWLSPVYASPMDDNGYDISNYQEVNPIFGTNKDLDELIEHIHERGMKIIMDLVVNHTSDMHHWFLDAKSSKDAKYRDYYIWQDEPKPAIHSIFSGPAWTYDEKTNQYYFHLFSKRQPDLNWHNPKLRQDIYQMMNYWLDKGIDGFRMDVIELIGKDVSKGLLGDGPYLETYLEEMYETCFKGRDIMNVGEMGGISVSRAQALTSNPKLGLHMTFQFSHLGIDEVPGKGKWVLKDYEPLKLKEILIKNNEIFKESGWQALFLSNHDQPRQVSRFGSEQHRIASAQMLFTMLYLQRGTPYVYMGEEIGMTGIQFDDIKKYKDIETINYYNDALSQGLDEKQVMQAIYKKSRDNSRTPFQWSNQPYAGFSSKTPWLSVNTNYKEVNLENDLRDPNGVYHYTKKLFEVRKKYDAFHESSFKPINPKDPNTFIYLRENEKHSILVITNLTAYEVTTNLEEFKDYELLLENNPTLLDKGTVLKPYHAAIYIKEFRR